MIECQNNYNLDCVRKLIQSGYKSMEVKQEPFDRFYNNLFEMMKLRVFGAGGCTAWYNNTKGVNQGFYYKLMDANFLHLYLCRVVLKSSLKYIEVCNCAHCMMNL